MKNLILILTFIPIFSAFGQSLLTPEEAVRLALEKNLGIKIARNDASISTNNVTWGAAGLVPQVSATGGASKSMNSTRQEYSTGNVVDKIGAESSQWNAAVQLNWTIFDGMAMFATFDRLKALREAGEINAQTVIEKTISSVFSAYYAVVRQEQVLKVLRKNVALSQERLQLTDEKVQLGAASGLQGLQAKSDANADKSAELRQSVLVENAKISLSQIIGGLPNTNFTVADNIQFAPSLVVNDLEKSALARNSSLVLARKNNQIAEIAIDEASGAYYPKLSFSLGYALSQAETQAGLIALNRTNGYTYGINASYTIFDGFNTARKVENARVLAQSGKLAENDVELAVKSAISQQFATYKNALEIAQFERENYLVAQKSVEIAMEKLRVGTIAPLELREAQKTLLDVENRRISAEYDAKIAETELLRLSGELLKGR